MKNLYLLLTLVLGLSCSKKESAQPESSKGNLSVAINIDGTILIKESNLKASQPTVRVDIYSLSGTVVKSFENYSEMPDQIELDEGQYYVVAQSSLLSKSDFESPHYFGQSSVFTITKTEKQNISVACTINNVKIVVTYADIIKSSFTSWQTVVYSESDSLVFGQTETRGGFFNPGDLKIKSTLTYTTSQGKVITKYIDGKISSAVGGKLYNIVVSASLSNGSAGISVAVSDSMSVETILLTDGSANTPPSSSVGGLLITEVMADPSKVSDDLGEWIELYNSSDKVISLIGKTMKLGTATVKFSSDLSVAAKGFVVLGKSNDVSINGGASIEYVYTGFTLPNSGSRTIQLLDTDGTSILCEMTYTSTSAGKSWALAKDKFTTQGAANSSSWNLSGSTYGSGDYGTPGAMNE